MEKKRPSMQTDLKQFELHYIYNFNKKDHYSNVCYDLQKLNMGRQYLL